MSKIVERLPIESLRGSDYTSMASVPMETEPGGLVGVLNVHTISRRDFTPRDIQLLPVIGRLIAGEGRRSAGTRTY